MDNIYSVYIHILPNSISGKENDMVYIGITRSSIKKRWANGKGYVRSRYFHRAIQKYGWDNFEHKVLFTNLSLEEASQKEQELIKQYKSNDRNYGFNILSGGVNGYVYDEETKKIMGEKRKIWLSDKEHHPMFGKHHSNETKVLISQKAKERIKKNGSPLKGFKHTDESKRHMSEAAKKRYKENPSIGLIAPMSIEARKKMADTLRKLYSDPTKNPNYGNRKKVICIETNEVFNSANEVAEKYNVHITAVYQGCKTGYATKVFNGTSKLHFRYYAEVN